LYQNEEVKIQKIETSSQEPKIRKDFGKAKFPVYQGNIWNFVKELNNFIMVEQVLLQEQKAVFLKSLPVDSLIEFSKVENTLTQEVWELEKHGGIIFRVLEPTMKSSQVTKIFMAESPTQGESMYDYMAKFRFYGQIAKVNEEIIAELFIISLPVKWQTTIQDVATNGG
jgi:hypothetical protein